MLSQQTLSYLDPQRDVSDQVVDELVRYAATRHKEAWKAVLLLHDLGQDKAAEHYLLQLQNRKLAQLSALLPRIWQQKAQHDAAQAIQPEATLLQAVLDDAKTANLTIVKNPGLFAQNVNTSASAGAGVNSKY